MWRRSAFTLGNSGRETQDSDKSISEEEDGFEDEWTGNPISLGGTGKNKAEVHVISQLEILRDSYKRREAEEFISSDEDREGFPLHDEIENPVFNHGGGSNCDLGISSSYNTFNKKALVCLPSVASKSHSEDEKIRPPSFTNARNNPSVTWSEASREVEALVGLNENSGCPLARASYAKEIKSCQGVGATAKSKPKFVFPHHASEGPSLVVTGNKRTVSDNIADLRQILHQKETQKPGNCIDPPELARGHHHKEQSVTALLDCFKQRNDMLPLGNLDDDDDLPEELDSGYPSRIGDEEKLQSLVANSRRTMGNQFHEAFGTVYVNDERQYSDIYGMLRQVMQKDKERDKEYLQNIGAESRMKNDGTCLFVRILSKFLEAKLILYAEKNTHLEMNGAARTLSVIFNPRLCSNIELEVGNLICIHPPWKEVYVKEEDEIVFLCSYFSEAPRLGSRTL